MAGEGRATDGEPSADSADESAEHRHSATRGGRSDIGRNRRVDLGECSQHVALQRRQRYAVAIDDAVSGGCAKAFTTSDDSGQVQRIGGADRDQRLVGT